MKIKLYVKGNPTLVRQLRRRDGVAPHHHVQRAPGAPMPLDPHEHYQDVPPVPTPAPPAMFSRQPGRDGAVKRLGFIVGHLASRYLPSRGRPRVTVGDHRTYAMLGELYGHTPESLMATAAFYHAPTHAIYMSGSAFAYLESDNTRLWVAAVHLLAHEWYHAMRNADDHYTPLEEGGAEIFASRMGEQICGVDHPDLRLLRYAPFRAGLLEMDRRLHPPQINDHRRPDVRAFSWVLRARTQSQMLWMKNQLHHLGGNPLLGTNLLRYYGDNEGPE